MITHRMIKLLGALVLTLVVSIGPPTFAAESQTTNQPQAKSSGHATEQTQPTQPKGGTKPACASGQHFKPTLNPQPLPPGIKASTPQTSGAASGKGNTGQ